MASLSRSKRPFGALLCVVLLAACGGGGTATTPFEVLRTAPENGASNVSPTTSVAVTFSTDVDPATLSAETFRVSGATAQRIAYDSAQSTATWISAAPLTAPATFTVTLTTDLKSAQGVALREPFTFRFATGAVVDTDPPQVADVLPATDAAAVPVTTAIRVRFSESINESSWSVAFQVAADGATQAVAGSLSYSDAERTGVFTPTAALAFNKRYTATVSRSLADRSGNLLPAAVTWRFTTEAARDVEAPVVTASPPGGTYAALQSVTLTANEPATIFYTTQSPFDAPQPNERYTGPINLPAGITVLRFRALDTSGNASSEAAARYVVDLAAPSSTIVPTSVVHNTGFNITLATTDNSNAFPDVAAPRIYYKIETSPGAGSGCAEVGNGTGDAPDSILYTAPFALPVQAGEEKEFRVCYRAIDAAGNRESVRAQRYVVDLLGVFTRATPAGGVYNTPQTINLSAFKDAQFTRPDTAADIYATTDNTAVTYADRQRVTGPLTLTQSTTLRYRSRDAAGNEEPTEHVEAYVIDTQPPTSTFAAVPPGVPETGTARRVQTAPFSFTFTASDNLAGAGVYYVVQENPLSGTACPTFGRGTGQATLYGGMPVAAPVTDGVEKILRVCYRAIDAAGNEEAVQSVTFVVDTLRPAVTATPTAGAYPMAPLNIGFSVTKAGQPGTADPGARVRCAYAAGACPVALPALTDCGSVTLPEGRWCVRYFGVDEHGNEEATQHQDTWVADVTAPSAQLVNGADNSAIPAAGQAQLLTRSSLTVAFTRTDNLSAAATVNVYFRLANAAGTVPPPVAAPSAVIEQRWDGNALQLNPAAGATTTYAIKYMAVDEAGNQSAIKTAVIVFDKQPPTTTVSRSSGVYNMALCGATSLTDCSQNRCPVVFTADDAQATIHYRLGGGAETTCRGTCTAQLSSASAAQAVEIWSTDDAGNEELPHLTRSYTVDVCPPGAPQTPLVAGKRARLQFTAPGDDVQAAQASGKVHSYELAVWASTEAPSAATFDSHRVRVSPCDANAPASPPASIFPPPAQLVLAGAVQALTVPGLHPGGSFFVAARAVDNRCNRGEMSPVVSYTSSFYFAPVRSTSVLGAPLAAIGDVDGNLNAETGLPIGDFTTGLTGSTPMLLQTFHGDAASDVFASYAPDGAPGVLPTSADLFGGFARAGNADGVFPLELFVSHVSNLRTYVTQYRRLNGAWNIAQTFDPANASCAGASAVVDLGDFDGDGLADVIWLSGAQVCIRRSSAPAPFQTFTLSPPAAMLAAIGNFNVDVSQRDDFATASGSQLNLYADSVTTTAAGQYTNARAIAALASAKSFSGAGRADLAIADMTVSGCNAVRCNYQVTLKVFTAGSLGAAFQPAYTLAGRSVGAAPGLTTPVVLASGDLDGDGFGDVVALVSYGALSWSATVFYGGASGAPARTSHFTAADVTAAGITSFDGLVPSAMTVVGDVNGDGLSDIGFGFPNSPDSNRILIAR